MIEEGDIILFKTKNSDFSETDPYNPNFTFCAGDAAQFLAEKKVKAVGIDYIGMERNQPDHPTHKNLLGNNIAIIEGLRLKHVPEGEYFLICAPVKILAEAAPARALLWKLT